MWNEKELLEELENYFKNNTKEQILKDLEETGCLEYMEEATPEEIEKARKYLEKKKKD